MTLEELRPYHQAIVSLVEKHHLQNPRLFGSVMTGKQTLGSDIDILVDATEHTTLFDMGSLQQELSQLLDAPVDVVTPEDLSIKFRQQVVASAQPL